MSGPKLIAPVRYDLDDFADYLDALRLLAACIRERTPLRMGTVQDGRVLYTWRGVPTAVTATEQGGHGVLRVQRMGDSSELSWWRTIEIAPQIAAET